MKSKITLLCIISVMGISCNKIDKISKPEKDNNVYIDSDRLNPAFLNVLDSFIRSDDKINHEVFVILSSDIGSINFNIVDVDSLYAESNASVCQMIYKDRRVYFYTALDFLLKPAESTKRRPCDRNARRWYVEMENQIGINDAGLKGNNEYHVKLIDTSGNKIHFVEPVIN